MTVKDESVLVAKGGGVFVGFAARARYSGSVDYRAEFARVYVAEVDAGVSSAVQ